MPSQTWVSGNFRQATYAGIPLIQLQSDLLVSLPQCNIKAMAVTRIHAPTRKRHMSRPRITIAFCPFYH